MSAQNITNAVIPPSMPRRRSSTASGPWRECVDTASTEATVGNAASAPATAGPNRPAAALMPTIISAVSAMRSGSSQRGTRTAADGPRRVGRAHSAMARRARGGHEPAEEAGLDPPGQRAQHGGRQPRERQTRPPSRSGGPSARRRARSRSWRSARAASRQPSEPRTPCRAAEPRPAAPARRSAGTRSAPRRRRGPTDRPRSSTPHTSDAAEAGGEEQVKHAAPPCVLAPTCG